MEASSFVLFDCLIIVFNSYNRPHDPDIDSIQEHFPHSVFCSCELKILRVILEMADLKVIFLAEFFRILPGHNVSALWHIVSSGMQVSLSVSENKLKSVWISISILIISAYCVNYTSLFRAGDLLKLSVFNGLASFSISAELHLLICSPAHAARF